MSSNVFVEKHEEAVFYILDKLEAIPSLPRLAEDIQTIFDQFCAERGLETQSVDQTYLFPASIASLDVRSWITDSDLNGSMKEISGKLLDLLNNARSASEFELSAKNHLSSVQDTLAPDEKNLVEDAIEIGRQSYLMYVGEANQEAKLLKHVKLPGSDAERVNTGKAAACDMIGGLVAGGLAGFIGASAISVIMQL